MTFLSTIKLNDVGAILKGAPLFTYAGDETDVKNGKQKFDRGRALGLAEESLWYNNWKGYDASGNEIPLLSLKEPGTGKDVQALKKALGDNFKMGIYDHLSFTDPEYGELSIKSVQDLEDIFTMLSVGKRFGATKAKATAVASNYSFMTPELRQRFNQEVYDESTVLQSTNRVRKESESFSTGLLMQQLNRAQEDMKRTLNINVDINGQKNPVASLDMDSMAATISSAVNNGIIKIREGVNKQAELSYKVTTGCK